MLVLSIDVPFLPVEELKLKEVVATDATLLDVLAGAWVELWEPVTDFVEVIAKVVLACVLSPGSDEGGETDPHLGV